MKMEKKSPLARVLAVVLTLALMLSLASCGNSGNAGNENANDESGVADTDAATQDAEEVENSAEETDAASDLAYVQDKGTLIVGITEFEPMDYQDDAGNWIGFDADMARAFAESLGVEPVFQIITDWDNKVFELKGRTVDVVWNGMTLTEEVLSSLECSRAYFNNAQVVVVPAASSAAYANPEATIEDLSAATFAVESGSTGQTQAEENNFNYTAVADQATALLEVASGTADAAIIDYLMARAMTGEGTSYADLTDTVVLSSEEYGVGFRKGSDMAEALNNFFHDAYQDGTMQALAETYGIADALIAQ